MRDRNPFWQLLLARMREFYRQPEVVFWVFGFPILLAVGLGIAFREKAQEVIAVGIVRGAGSAAAAAALSAKDSFTTKLIEAASAEDALRLGKVSIVVESGATLTLRFDPTRPESVLARAKVDDALQRAAGRADPLKVEEQLVTRPGARYIDFLIPGLLGMNIMSGGLWGIGFVIVEMRSRKLLKRLVATPMKRTHFMAASMASRMVLVIGELALLLFFGWLVFGMIVQGSWLLVTLLSLLGAFTFAGIGLLVASRAKKIETVSGLMNLVMLPMFVTSGVFFSSERFPEVVQPIVRALPLTALNDALRAVILEGADLTSQLTRIAILGAWGVVSFVLALKLFRWT
ncbi:MAG: ABC transporter permease [Planctomycetota bacterium]|nr:ABC transporter permease [Planctomycetota bacterium]